MFQLGTICPRDTNDGEAPISLRASSLYVKLSLAVFRQHGQLCEAEAHVSFIVYFQNAGDVDPDVLLRVLLIPNDLEARIQIGTASSRAAARH